MSFSRKKFLQTGALTAIGSALSVTGSAQPVIVAPKRKRMLRVAHLTDIHVQPQAPAPHGFAAALHGAQSLTDKPDIIFSTGDCIMDSMSKHRDVLRKEWDVLHSTLQNENSLEM